jgi:hypothetical protein
MNRGLRSGALTLTALGDGGLCRSHPPPGRARVEGEEMTVAAILMHKLKCDRCLSSKNPLAPMFRDETWLKLARRHEISVPNVHSAVRASGGSSWQLKICCRAPRCSYKRTVCGTGGRWFEPTQLYHTHKILCGFSNILIDLTYLPALKYKRRYKWYCGWSR